MGTGKELTDALKENIIRVRKQHRFGLKSFVRKIRLEVFKKMTNNEEKITRIDDHVPTKKEIEEKLKEIPKEECERYRAEARAFLERHKINLNTSK